TDGGHDARQRSFLANVRSSVRHFCARYRAVAPELEWVAGRIDGYDSAASLFEGLLHAVRRTGHKLYLLLDAYNTFSTLLLADGDLTVYDDAAGDGTGFVRTFYAVLKTGTSSGVLGRTFITGVLPDLTDDLRRGFNVVTDISDALGTSTLVGFTPGDVERA